MKKSMKKETKYSENEKWNKNETGAETGGSVDN
jgi:hypothetical protein